ncbi:MAG: hypothetical protein DRG36_03820 [Deltaproteobacteria bacterium]|nr:MAG: hypothetical protein DRG36_03820 [Deltaproteobacteria bacterium]
MRSSRSFTASLMSARYFMAKGEEVKGVDSQQGAGYKGGAMAQKETKRRLPRKKIKEPDEFRTWGSRALDYVIAHRRAFTAVAVIVAAIVVSSVIWIRYQQRREERAYALLSEGIEGVHSEKEISEKIAPFDKLLKEYPGSRASTFALLYRANLLIDEGKGKEAEADIERLLRREVPPSIRVLALSTMGEILFREKKWERSRDYFQKALGMGEEWPRSYLLLKIASCEERMGKKKEALSHYKELLKTNPPPDVALYVRIKIEELEGK